MGGVTRFVAGAAPAPWVARKAAELVASDSSISIDRAAAYVQWQAAQAAAAEETAAAASSGRDERRDSTAERRLSAVERRESAAERRESAAERRDSAAERRDSAGSGGETVGGESERDRKRRRSMPLPKSVREAFEARQRSAKPAAQPPEE